MVTLQKFTDLCILNKAVGKFGRG